MRRWPGFLTVSGANQGTYSWTDPNGTSPFQNISPSPNSTTTYTASGVDANNCLLTSTVLVTVNPNPTVTASATPSLVCKGKPVNLSSNGANTYTWGASAGSATTQIVSVVPALEITYNYSVTGTDVNGCIGTANVSVKAELCTGINELQNVNALIDVYPNPNNGNFTIKASAGLKLNIVNELGQVVKTIITTESNEVSVQGLSKGIYFITGQNNGLTINKKIVVN